MLPGGISINFNEFVINAKSCPTSTILFQFFFVINAKNCLSETILIEFVIQTKSCPTEKEGQLTRKRGSNST